ncbi:ML domain-containing protein [Streptomyces sp. NPDC054956]
MTSWSWEISSYEPSTLEIMSVTAIPDAIDEKTTPTFAIKVTADTDVAKGAYVVVVIKHGRTKLADQRYDLFEELAKTDGAFSLTSPAFSNPIPKGDIELRYTWGMPAPLPRAKFTAQVSLYAAEGDTPAEMNIHISTERTFSDRSPAAAG